MRGFGSRMRAVPIGAVRLKGPPLVLDALAFSTLRADDIPPGRTGNIIVTPHSGEMAKFLGTRREDVEKDPLNAARRAAAMLPAVIAMKGAETYVVAEDGEAWLSRNGCIGLATSGSVTPLQVFWPGCWPGERSPIWRRRGGVTSMVRRAGI
jgi:NAD(P)H-hydrate repair Nnr-like enzyme with NAD(P)H-hydrate dehydratase domain